MIIIRIMFFIMTFSMAFWSQLSVAKTETYYENHAKGWHWYQKSYTHTSRMRQKTDPTVQLKRIKSNLHHALATALLHPTQKNIAHYIFLQNALAQQSSVFANQWQATLLNYPQLNYGLTHPTNHLAQQIATDRQKQLVDRTLQRFSKKNGLFFFYRSDCPYCRRFAPILKNFADHYHISIIPITTDGISIPEFPNSKIDRGQAKKFNVRYEPSLFAVDPYSHQAYPVSYGLLSREDLQKRIFDIANHFSSN